VGDHAMIAEGAPVTIVIERRGVPVIEKARVRSVDGVGGFTCYLIRFRPNEEGVYWIRGHHEDGAPEISALRAALALVGMQW
jgi:hypothetical protein